ncbi:hypothetical protein Gotri_007819 [Gossypium trilobum]|uniref:UDP-rhamnose:rhamnosyltransferase 1 n=1 Tax=Gossypium trilobum TaxID=34281 RepID=A0A7J9EI48_9ROSI|nr:hypothetical protein [Gossypium trilobum]
MATTHLHMVMVPWSAFGHLIPFFQLALQLAKADDKQQLPEGCEATVDIPFEKIQYLKIAYDLLRQPVKQFVIDQKPDWILIDVIPHWMVEIAQEQHIPLVNFSVFLASVYSFFMNQTLTRWLDVQKPNSVVLVGFGSERKLSKEQTHEIAYGVELSGLPFLWALRKPHWAFNELDALPCGFQERTRERGMVCIGWAPQLEILGHSSIGGSLFHAGWGSIIETLQFGHSLVVLPFVIDQPLNARLLVDKGLGVEIERSEDGSFSRDDIAKALRLAMVSAEGEKLRIQTREAAQVFGNRDLHDSYFNRFVEYLKENGAAN